MLKVAPVGSGDNVDWTKIKTKHFLFTRMGDREVASLVRLLCLTAHLERVPKEDEIQQAHICGPKTLKRLHKRFESEGQSLDKVLAKVVEDVDKVTTKRLQGRNRQKTYRNSNASHNATDKIRLDKIRQDNITNRGVKFKEPTNQEVKDFFKEANIVWEHDRFYNFYESKDWFVGRNKMKKWQAAARNWIKKAREGAFKASSGQIVENPTRDRNNAPEPAKTTKNPPLKLESDPPPPEFKKMVKDLAAKKGIS